MTDLRKAAEMALEVLSHSLGHSNEAQEQIDKTKQALRQALAQPEQEPVAVNYMMRWVELLKRLSDHGKYMKIPSGMTAGDCYELALELEQFIKTTPPSIESAVLAEQEPVAWVLYYNHENGAPRREIFYGKAYMEETKSYNETHRGLKCQVVPLYTAPPKREWVGLADVDKVNLCGMIFGGRFLECIDAVEAKLKEKNT